MSRESIIMKEGPWGAQQTISHYESFGWELMSLNGEQIAMSRETQDSVYGELVKRQAAYEAKLKQYEAIERAEVRHPEIPEPFHFGT